MSIDGKSKKGPRVSIRKETLRHLTNVDLDRVAGGVGLDGGDQADFIKVTQTCCWAGSCITKRGIEASAGDGQSGVPNDGSGDYQNAGYDNAGGDQSYGDDSSGSSGDYSGDYSSDGSSDYSGDGSGDYSGGDGSSDFSGSGEE